MNDFESDSNSEEIRDSWIIFKLLDRFYGVKTEYVHEMVILDKVIKTPDLPDNIRGVVNLRGSIFPVLDLSKRLGMESIKDWILETCDILDAREQDHVNWLNELKASVTEKREFRLTTDPHKCAFGKWYDTFKTENYTLRYLLSKFDSPHKAIHSIADHVGELIGQGDNEGALGLIDATWNNELYHMRELFETTRNFLKKEIREIVIVTQVDDNKFGVLVDSVSEVRNIPPEIIEPVESVEMKMDLSLLFGIGKLNDNIVLLIDINKLL